MQKMYRGTTGGNRTPVSAFEAPCILHYTTVAKVTSLIGYQIEAIERLAAR